MNASAPCASTSVISEDNACPCAARFNSSIREENESVAPRFIRDTAATPIVVDAISSVAECAAISSRILRCISAGVSAICIVPDLFVRSRMKVLGGVGSATQHCQSIKTSQQVALQGFAGNEIGAAATTAVPDPAGPCASTSLRAGWRLMVRLSRRIEDCWIGDFLGVCGLIFLLFTMPLLALGVGGE